MFRRKIQVVPGWDPHRYDRAARKAGRLETSMALEFADMAGSGMARAFGDYRKHRSPESLAEIEEGLQVLWAITQLLRARQELLG